MTMKFQLPSIDIRIARNLRRLAVGALALGLGLGWVRAEPTTGSLTGHVIDSQTKLSLAGARIAVPDKNLETFTDQQGNYQLAEVPSGPVSVNVSYVGYATQTLTATIAAGQSTRLDVAFGGEIVQMKELRITGDVVGTARAINSQRSAPALTSVMAADAIGRLPDKNVAEALGRIPGVDVYRDKGEGRFVVIRGLDPIYVSTEINGLRSATSEKGTREFPMDIIGADMISQLVVHKVSTPDMDADGLGGSVDIRTRTGFDADGPQAAIGLGGNMNHNGPDDRRGGYRADAYYGDQYDGGRLGVFVGVFTEARPFSVFNDENTGTWTNVVSPTDHAPHWFYTENDFRHYELTRWRDGFNTSFDFKIDDTSKVYLRFMTSYFIEREHQWITGFPFSSGTITALSDTSATVNLKGVIKSESEIVDDKHITSVVGGYDKTAGAWTFNGILGYSVGKYSRAQPTIQYTTSGTGAYTYGFTTPWDVSVAQVSGASVNDPASYAFSTKSNYTQTVANERNKTIHGDVRYDFQLADLPAYVKFGGQYRAQDKNQDTSVLALGAVPFALADVIETDTKNPSFPNSFIIQPAAVETYYADPAAFKPTVNLSKSYLSDFQAQENVGAGYAMGGVTMGQFKLMGGLRVEDTHFTMDGWSYDSTTGTVSPVSGGRDYVNALPGLIGTYEIDPRNLIRASVTTSIARPDYAATIIGRTVDDVNKVVTQGNPNLPALQAVNYDVSFEHYYSSLGVVSAGFFYKDIKNFAYQAQSGTDPLTGYALTTYLNGPSAWIYGLELNWVQRLTMLPEPFDGLGVFANTTVGDSQASYPTRPGESIPFVGYSKVFGNAGVSYEKHGLKLRLSASYHSHRLEVDSAIGANYTQDPYEDRYTQYDFGSSYTFREHWEAYFNVGNIFNAHLHEYYNGGAGRKLLQNNEQDGINFDAGIRWSL
jgi:TonB-dependent receptor